MLENPYQVFLCSMILDGKFDPWMRIMANLEYLFFLRGVSSLFQNAGTITQAQWLCNQNLDQVLGILNRDPIRADIIVQNISFVFTE